MSQSNGHPGSGRPVDPLDQEGAKRVVAAVLADPQPLELVLPLADAWSIILALQLTVRHPGLGRFLRARFVEVGHDLQRVVVLAHPELRDIAEAGWDPSYDIGPGT